MRISGWYNCFGIGPDEVAQRHVQDNDIGETRKVRGPEQPFESIDYHRRHRRCSSADATTDAAQSAFPVSNTTRGVKQGQFDPDSDAASTSRKALIITAGKSGSLLSHDGFRLQR
jgi:hypothetical protein